MIEINMNSMDGIVLMTAGKKIEENIKVTPVASLILPEYNGETELLVPTVSGVWYFNEPVSIVSDIEQMVTFTTRDGKNFKGMSLQVDGLYVNYITLDGSYMAAFSDEFMNWYDNVRTIDFGTEPQEVSEEFYAWLTANAVKQ